MTPVVVEQGDAAANLRQALEFAEFGFAMQRQNLRRRHPGWTEDELREAFEAWLSRADEPLPPGLRIRPR